MAQLISVQPLQRSAVETAYFALLRFGLRPFFLLASGFAVASIGLWLTQFAGSLPNAALSGQSWHAHETLFSFNLAVAIGFLLTTGRNRSDRLAATGLRWAPLALIWLAVNVLLLTPLNWAAAYANSAFPLATGAALAVSLWAAHSRREYLHVGLLAPTGTAELGVRLSLPGVGDWSAWLGVQIAFALRALDVLPRPRLNGRAG